MGINLGNTSPSQQTASAVNVQTQAASTTTDLVEVPTFNMEAERQATYDMLKQSPEIQALTSQIEINNIETITGFGAEAAEEISRASDTVLNGVSLPQLNESSDLLVSLNKVMEQFQPDELAPKQETFWDKIVNFFKGGLKNMKLI